MRFRSLSNCLRSKNRFLPKKNLELSFVASAPFNAPWSTPLTPLNLIDLTRIIPVSRHADAEATTAATTTKVAARRDIALNITGAGVQTMCHDCSRAGYFGGL